MLLISLLPSESLGIDWENHIYISGSIKYKLWSEFLVKRVQSSEALTSLSLSVFVF